MSLYNQFVDSKHILTNIWTIHDLKKKTDGINKCYTAHIVVWFVTEYV